MAMLSVQDLAAAAEQVEGGTSEGDGGAGATTAAAARKKRSAGEQSGGSGSVGTRGDGSEDDGSRGREVNAGKKGAKVKNGGKGGGKRAKFNDKGELLLWYCCSCKQSLKPEDFDPGLETCRVCLAKRRAKDRAKKRLRGLQIKHHLLSADEKDVAAFLLGLYHPALGNNPGNQSTQMHVQATPECTAFVKDMQEILEDTTKSQADEIIRTFLGLDEHGNKLHTEIPLENEDVPCDASCKSEKNESKRARKSSARLSTQQKQSLEKNLKRVCKKYGALLANPKKQTWVRFAKEDQVEGRADLPAQGIKFSSPVHEQRVEIGTNEEQVGDVYNSIMQGVDPACSHFLYEFLFADEAPSYKKNGQIEDVESNSSEGGARLSDDGDLALKGVQKPALFEPTLDEQLNGNAYVFHGSLVMGWIGNSRTEKRELLAQRNGILPDDLQPQALSRGGRIFDARNPNALLPLDETGELYGFSDELALFPVIDSSRDDIRIQLPPGAFSENLGVRALHDGNYIDSEIRKKRRGGFELMLFPNGRSRQRSDVILLGAVQVQCFVRSGTAKELPIGNNLELLMIPSATHVAELQQGIERIHETAGPTEARQFLSSVAYVLQHGEPYSQRFAFVLELASVLKLPKTLDLLNRIGALAKASSGSSEDCLSNCQNSGAGGKLSLGTNAAHLMRNIVARPLLCLCTVFLQLFVTMSFASVNMATQYRYLLTMVVAAACSIVPTRGALRVEAYAGVFVALFDGANASLLRTAGASLHATYAFALFTTFALSALHAHSYVGIIASLCASHVSFWSLGFRPDVLSTLALSLPSADADVVPRHALLLYRLVVHAVFAVVAPFATATLLFAPRFRLDAGGGGTYRRRRRDLPPRA